MAESKSAVLEVYKFPTLAAGYSISAPPRSLTPDAGGPLFRAMNNLTAFRGMLGSWYGVYRCSDFEANLFTVENNGAYQDTTPKGLKNGQTPMFLFVDFPMSFPDSSTTSPTDFGSLLVVAVTSREIHIYSPQDQTWYNATPIYTTPAITVDVNGTTGVVTTTAAADANWSQYKIAPGQLIEFNADGNWWQITSVNSDTQLTTNYTGANLTADPYTIRRCFGGREYSCGENLLYAQVFNGNLFLGGRMLGGATAGPAVLKVADIYSNVYVTDYILAGFDLTGGMTADGQVIADLWDIKGLKVLQDGRVVVATTEVPSGRVGATGSRLRYSSNDDAYQWVASPGGFIDVTEAGEITALGALDPNTLTVHFNRGIHVATFTGQDDPPLNLQKSAATVGTCSPRSIANYGNMELFLGADGAIHGFDGSSTARLIGEDLEIAHMGTNRSQYRSAQMLIANTVGLVDPRRGHYRLFFNDNNGDYEPSPDDPSQERCVCYVLDLNTRYLYREEYGCQITAATWPAMGFSSVTYQVYPSNSGGDFGDILVGMPSWAYNNGTAAAASLYLGILSPYSQKPTDPLEDANENYTVLAHARRYYNNNNGPYDETQIAIGFETDDLDFSLPGIDKTLDHLDLWVSAYDLTAMVTGTKISASPNGGSNWYDAAPTYAASYAGLGGVPSFDVPLSFYFAPVAGEKWRIRLRGVNLETATNQFLGFQLHRMNVYYQVQGEIESVNPDLTP